MVSQGQFAQAAEKLNQELPQFTDEELMALIKCPRAVVEFFDSLGEKYWPICYVFRGVADNFLRMWERRHNQVYPENEMNTYLERYRQAAEKLKSFLAGTVVLAEQEKEDILEIVKSCELFFSFDARLDMFLKATQELKAKLES